MTTSVPLVTAPVRELLDRCERLASGEPAQLLGVGRDADPAAVRAAFLALARRLHPDAGAGALPDERQRMQAAFVRLTEAFQALGGSRGRGPDAAGGQLVPRRPRPAPAPRSALSPAPPPTPEPARPPGASGADVADRRERVAQALAGARGFVARGDSEGAVHQLHQVLTLADGEERGQIRLLLARAYLADGRWRRYGIGLLREMTQEDPSNADALTLLGGLYLREGLLARAEATLARALALDPGNAEAREGLRTLRARLGTGRSADVEPAPSLGRLAQLFSRRR